MKVNRYLIVSGNGDVRVVTRHPRLRYDEVAFPLRITVPDMWGRLYMDRTVEVALPEPGEVGVDVEEVIAAGEAQDHGPVLPVRETDLGAAGG